MAWADSVWGVGMIEWDNVSTAEMLFIAVILGGVAVVLGTGFGWAVLY
jgi:hypothetical protein